MKKDKFLRGLRIWNIIKVKLLEYDFYYIYIKYNWINYNRYESEDMKIKGHWKYSGDLF